MRHIFLYFKPYLPWLLVLAFFVAGQAYVNLALPGYTSRIVNEVVSKFNFEIIYSVGIKMLFITLLGGFFTVATGFLAARIAAGYARSLRAAVFSKAEDFSLGEFNAFSSSSLITRTTNDIQQLQNALVMLMRMTLLAPLMGIGAVIKAYQLAPDMYWIMFAAIGFLSAILFLLFLVAIPKFTLIQQLVDRLGLLMREMLTGVRVIRAYDKDATVEGKFSETNKESTRLNVFVGRMMSLISPVMTLLMGLAGVAVVWAGAYLVQSGALSLGDIVALMQYVSQAILSFFIFSFIFVMVPRAAVSARRIEEILATITKIKDPEKPVQLPFPVRGEIRFENVSFSYAAAEQPILSDISFTAAPGKITAIVGSTGSGKSTLLNLIPRLHDVTAGRITLDGTDIRRIAQHELRAHIGYVPQKAQLFAGTIRGNIAYGAPEAADEDIRKAAETAQAWEFISRLPEKLDSPVAQGGTNLSGGQKQRIAIARALAKRAPVMLFDDSFSALDYRTDAALRAALKKELKGSAIIIVAQRVSTIMDADNIIVLDNGKVVGQGRHQELFRSCAVYREIASSQLSAEEMDASGA
jgi:ATP-binding cassette subfamily B protein